MVTKEQLKVVKSDGGSEQYLHTKVIGAINNALNSAGEPDIGVAEELAEVVTYFLYNKHGHDSISSNEILSIIKAVLTGARYEDAAVALNEHYYLRRLKRSRIEVVSVDLCDLTDAETLWGDGTAGHRNRWDKSRIVADLITKGNIDYHTARTIAAIVEEKVIAMGTSVISTSLIKQLVLTDTAAILRAQNQLQITATA